MELNLNTSDGAWTCDIFTHIKYEYVPQWAKMKATSKRPLGPWNPCEPDEQLFASITDKRMLGDAIFGAQQVLINPTKAAASFRPGASQAIRSMLPVVEFSPNVVRLNITGPGLPDLSFFDLPGVIALHSDSEYFPEMIRNLVLSYIEEPNCLILQTLTMNHDPVNSNAANLIKKAKARDRTMGVLTKPDMLTDGDVGQFARVLRNEKFPLGHGYYVVLNNTRDDISSTEARDNEQAFFDNTPCFSNALADCVGRFGTSRLQHQASRILFKNSIDCLPGMNDEVRAKADEVQQLLDALPKPPEGNLSAQIQSKIDRLSVNIQHHLAGAAENSDYFSRWHSEAKRLRAVMVGSYPRVLLPQIKKPVVTSSNRANGMSNGLARPAPEVHTVDDGDDDNCVEVSAQLSQKRKPAASPLSTPTKRARVEESMTPEDKSVQIRAQSKLSQEVPHFSC